MRKKFKSKKEFWKKNQFGKEKIRILELEKKNSNRFSNNPVCNFEDIKLYLIFWIFKKCFNDFPSLINVFL